MRITLCIVRDSIPSGDAKRRLIAEVAIDTHRWKESIADSIAKLYGDGRYTYFAIVEDGNVGGSGECTIAGGKELTPIGSLDRPQ